MAVKKLFLPVGAMKAGTTLFLFQCVKHIIQAYILPLKRNYITLHTRTAWTFPCKGPSRREKELQRIPYYQVLFSTHDFR